LATKQVRTPAAMYFPINHNHYLFWQQQSRGAWAIGGELLQGKVSVLTTATKQKQTLFTLEFKSSMEMVTSPSEKLIT